MRIAHKLTAIATIVAATGCAKEDGLVDVRYTGEALAQIDGIVNLQTNATITGPVALSLIWSKFPGVAWLPINPPPFDASACAEPYDPANPYPHLGELYNLRTDVEFGTTQSVAYIHELPYRFTLTVNELPPPEAQLDLSTILESHSDSTVTPIPGGSGFASWGAVIAFVDGNNNGLYDPGTPGNVPDQVVGVSEWGNAETGTPATWLLFIDGTIPALPAASGPFTRSVYEARPGLHISTNLEVIPTASITPGFNLLAITAQSNALPIVNVLPQGSEIPVNLGDFTSSMYQCTEYETQITQGGELPADLEARGGFLHCTDEWRAPSGELVSVASYRWTTFDSTQAEKDMTCIERTTTHSSCLAEGQMQPTDWPCPGN